MSELIQYDVAISCAEEDIEVAEAVADSLQKLKVSYYLYTEHRAKHWGENILKISLDRYGACAQHVLMIVSEAYVKKHWSDLERQIAQTISRVGEAYILPLRIDDTEVKGLSENSKYEMWRNNPNEIARLIKEKIETKKMQQEKQEEKKGATTQYFIAEKQTIFRDINGHQIINM